MSDAKKPEKTYTQAELEAAIQSTAKAIAEQVMPALVAASSLAKQPQQESRQAVNRDLGPRCQICQQHEVACGGVPEIKPDENGNITKKQMDEAYSKNHTKMCVYPSRYPEFAPWFRGSIINGVVYLSNGVGHYIWVPKNTVGGIARMIQDYETNEREMRMGKVKEHNSGSVHSPSRVNHTDGWR